MHALKAAGIEFNVETLAAKASVFERIKNGGLGSRWSAGAFMARNGIARRLEGLVACESAAPSSRPSINYEAAAAHPVSSAKKANSAGLRKRLEKDR